MSEPKHTPSGIPVQTVHGPAKAAGHFPFTRGIHSSMYAGRLWTMRQYAGFGTAAQTNRRFRDLLAHGQTGLSVAFDLPTQMGYDSDHALAEGEVGRAGVAIDTVDDLAVLFEGIPLDQVSTSMTINSTAATLLAMYIVVAEEHGVPRTKLRGTIQNDVLKEYVARGTYIYPPDPSLRLVTDIFRFVHDEGMPFNPISVSGYHIREAGATAVQEVAYTLADAIEYLDRAKMAGLDPSAIAEQISFFFACHNDLFEEVAKFRAARRLWAHIVKERYGGSDKAARLRFHTQTGGSTLTAQQPLNNVVRVAVQALAAVLGGTQSLHTNAFDEALALPTADSARLALRTQQVLADESGTALTVDPLGGSYYVEYLTDEIEKRARALMAEVEQAGGAAACIGRGEFQDAIARSAYEYQKSIESGATAIVGVNEYVVDEAPPKLDDTDYSALESEQRSSVVNARKRRSGEGCARALEGLKQAAQGPEPLMPRIIDAVKARATLGEIAGALRNVWGEFGR